EAGAGLLVADADVALFIKRHGSLSLHSVVSRVLPIRVHKIGTVRESYDTVVISHSPRREEPLYAEAYLTRYAASRASPDARLPAPRALWRPSVGHGLL